MSHPVLLDVHPLLAPTSGEWNFSARNEEATRRRFIS